MSTPTSHLQEEWRTLLPKSTIALPGTHLWPLCVIAPGEGIRATIEASRGTPTWAITDGGALHHTTTQFLREEHYQQWGATGATIAWSLTVQAGHIERRYTSRQDLAAAVEREMVRATRKAAVQPGGGRFKSKTSPADFTPDRIEASLMIDPSEPWGRQTTIEDWRHQPFPELPTEPTTSPLPRDHHELAGIEVPLHLSSADIRERKEDLQRWVETGQKWMDAFLPWKKAEVKRFLHANKLANEAAARAAADGVHKPFGRVADLRVSQEELRPGARGRIWSWDQDDRCTEVTQSSVSTAVKFNAAHVRRAADEVHFKDRRILQQLLDTGVTHGTSHFPLASCAGCNHQGAALHHDAVSKMIREKEDEGHWVSGPTPTPSWIPFWVIPVNGSEARPSDDQIENWLQDLPYTKKVRGTWNGSYPHDDTDINSHCYIEADLNPPWTTMADVTDAACVLLSTECPVQCFKLDLRRAYTQMHHQATQHWRQCAYWARVDDGENLKSGFYTDGRAMWGLRIIGCTFHRAITTITVRYVTKALYERWLPHLRSQTARRWSNARTADGLDGPQSTPAIIQAFLDDFWILIASDEQEDVVLAHEIVLECFNFLGWQLSMNKFEEEGLPKPAATILGHEVDLKLAVRGVSPTKKLRLRHEGERFLQNDKCSRAALGKWLGLAQFIRHDVARKINFHPLYAVYHAGDKTDDRIRLSTRAMATIRKVLGVLDETRSLFHRPTHWIIPAEEIAELTPNADAAQQRGYGATMLMTDTLWYFCGHWSDRIKRAQVNIATLEAWVLLMVAATWGPHFTTKKIIFRTDSSAACFCLNTLKAKDKTLTRICHIWEDLQYNFGFEGLVLHCAAARNRLADVCSRMGADDIAQAVLQLATERGITATPKQMDVDWTGRGVDIDITDDILALTR